MHQEHTLKLLKFSIVLVTSKIALCFVCPYFCYVDWHLGLHYPKLSHPKELQVYKLIINKHSNWEAYKLVKIGNSMNIKLKWNPQTYFAPRAHFEVVWASYCSNTKKFHILFCLPLFLLFRPTIGATLYSQPSPPIRFLSN